MDGSPTVQTLATVDCDDELLRRVCALWTESFPTAPGRDRFAEAVARRAAAGGGEQLHFVTAADGSCVAAARTFLRRVRVAGRERPVLALASVATAADARGRGLGAAVVRAAWHRLGAGGVEECVFCTGVPAFYERLGAEALPPLDVRYPDADAKRFADPTLLRFATPRALPWEAGVFEPMGGGW